jgi:drug/metabolite transporter (DMT)-like permease
VTGPVLAATAGLGFGVFQTLNRRAVGGMNDAFLATFLQLLVALTVLAAATMATEDVGLLGDAPRSAIIWFALAGLVHFTVGWTFLNMSQMRIGAARTSPLLATNPVWGALIAAALLGELPRFVAWIGIAVVLGGAFLVSLERMREIGWGVGLRDAAPGLAAAFAWSISPICIKEGLEGLASPLLGMVVAVVAYAALLPLRPRPEDSRLGSLSALSFKLAAGVMVGFSVWARWLSLETTAVAVVLALGLLSVPVVMLLSPVLMGRHVERVTALVWAGGALVVAGGLLLVLVG